MRKVVHLGPLGSQGGMSAVMKNMLENPPHGWETDVIETHGPSPVRKISRWISSKSDLRRMIRSGEVDLAHIHVTHSFSWWRKLGLLRICEKFRLPTVVHIHSGKFEKFCSGIAGSSVKKELSKNNRKILVLEERWKTALRGFIPADAEVLPNFSRQRIDRSEHNLEGGIKLLLLARDSPTKGHNFAISILESLHEAGVDASLTMTGAKDLSSLIYPRLSINCLGWISEEEKVRLMMEADFLISPSDFEGSSMSVIESLLCGLPCIVSKTSSETVGSGIFVVDSPNPKDWASRIIDLHVGDQYGESVRITLENSKRFSVEMNQNKLSDIYGELMSRQQ